MLFHKCRCGALIPQNIAECEACAAKAAGQQSRHMEYNKHRRNKKTAAFYVSSEWRKTRAETIRRFDGVDIYAFYVLHVIQTADRFKHAPAGMKTETAEDIEARQQQADETEEILGDLYMYGI